MPGRVPGPPHKDKAATCPALGLRVPERGGRGQVLAPVGKEAEELRGRGWHRGELKAAQGLPGGEVGKGT